MGQSDIGGKRVLGTAPETWVRWLLQNPALDVLTTLTEEFRFVLRHSDSLLLVQDEAERFLVLTELQLHSDAQMPRRMRAYAALAEEKYALPVYPVVLRLLPPEKTPSAIACYHQEFRGIVAHQDYRLVKAWEIDAREILEREILTLVPYVPLMKGAGEAEVYEGVTLLRRHDAGEEMEVVLALFASFVMKPEHIRKIVRWDMVVLKESPWYQEILQEGQEKGLQIGFQEGRQEGLQEGRQEGLQEGRQEGLLEGMQQGILHMLTARFEPTREMRDKLAQRLRPVSELWALEQLVVKAAQVESLEAFWGSLEGYESGTLPGVDRVTVAQ